MGPVLRDMICYGLAAGYLIFAYILLFHFFPRHEKVTEMEKSHAEQQKAERNRVTEVAKRLSIVEYEKIEQAAEFAIELARANRKVMEAEQRYRQQKERADKMAALAEKYRQAAEGAA